LSEKDKGIEQTRLPGNKKKQEDATWNARSIKNMPAHQANHKENRILEEYNFKSTHLGKVKSGFDLQRELNERKINR
jgi:hypothetical protein